MYLDPASGSDTCSFQTMGAEYTHTFAKHINSQQGVFAFIAMA